MFIADGIQNIISAGTQQLILWISQVLPQVFLFLILLNAITRMIGQARVERLFCAIWYFPFCLQSFWAIPWQSLWDDTFPKNINLPFLPL